MNEKPNAVQNSSKCSHMFIDKKVMSQHCDEKVQRENLKLYENLGKDQSCQGG